MARKLERRSARILALILAFIMLGSVFAYMFGGSPPEKREVRLHLEDFRDWINLAPEGGLFYYFNFTELKNLVKKLGVKDPLVNLTDTGAINALNSNYLSANIVQLTGGINEFMLAEYGGYPLYFIDDNNSKVYFVKESDYEFGNFKVQVSKYGVGMISEISPLVIGYAPIVVEVAKNANENRKIEYAQYLSKLNGTFVFAFLVYGDVAGNVLKLNQTNGSIVDFFFQGFRYNFSSAQYEKVWGAHFIQNYFFTEINETEKDFEYYYFENFEDGFSVAVMGDKNFTKLLEARPNVMGVLIKEVESSELTNTSKS
ncbi:MAG: hypothetical protein NZ872_00380 [Archaeoglobaceae archaeon]|nr:hypothetical protein [Archaeoglobaceae archaeon]MDW8127656.1 hypothetical protein [Archaeoglobaceae archaeon]